MTARTIGLAGTGVIGSGWAVRALARGHDVVAWDPAGDAEGRLRAAVERAWLSATRLGLFPGADPARLRWAGSPEEVAADADWVQESAPEDEGVKRSLLGRLDAAAEPATVIASSSSGLLPTRLADGLSCPERLLIGHPFNPVYLLPLVEVVPGEATAEDAVAAAMAHYDDLVMHPLLVRNEVEGYLSDRLQEALWRENLHLVNDGAATTAELDDSIVYGPGLRWAAMGTNLTFHLAGGEGGMRHMLGQFGPALKLPWTRLEAPELTGDLIEAMAAGTDDQAGGRSIAELERQRDDCLLAVMRALRPAGVGAGRLVAEREARILAARASAETVPWTPGTHVPAPLSLYSSVVEPDWVDYNGHMTEWAFLTAFGWASDALFRYLGIDESYRSGGHSYYTVETHLNHRREASEGETLRVATQVLGSDAKRLHVFHTMRRDGELLCTGEQMLVHVDTAAGRSAPLLPGPAAAVAAVTAAHASMPVPPQGRGCMAADAATRKK
ncbi:MAG: 3-hydroxyacyl-CoA dehydrogenase NAD-binding domain-containing protein [Acidimicrobiaceae bacterium]|nr:3-hydroxyacyl-CoA dehydrogenase NAD-binding domain-containing protein [Acidimicrobiaceae bacterium]